MRRKSFSSFALCLCALIHVAPHAQAMPVMATVFGAAVQAPVGVAPPPANLVGAVLPAVVATGHDLQVFGPIVQPVAVDVVNDFTSPQRSPQDFRHHNAMLSNIPAFLSVGMVGQFQKPITVFNNSTALPIRSIFTAQDELRHKFSSLGISTSSGTKRDYASMTSLSLKRTTASGASQNDAISTGKMLTVFRTKELNLRHWTRLNPSTKRFPAMVARLNNVGHDGSFVDMNSLSISHKGTALAPTWTVVGSQS